MRSLIAPIFTTFLLLNTIECSYAQKAELLRLPLLTDVSDVPWKDSVYRFNNFQRGNIHYTKKFDVKSNELLNYNLYYEGVVFINSVNDTVIVSDPRLIDKVEIGSNTFLYLYGKCFYEMILDIPIALVVEKKFVLRNLGQKSVGYQTVERETTSLEVRGVVTDFDRFYEITPRYFLLDRDKKKLYNITKSSLTRLFPKKKSEIGSYLSKRNVDLESRADLIELITFCSQSDIQ